MKFMKKIVIVLCVILNFAAILSASHVYRLRDFLSGALDDGRHIAGL